MHNPQVDLNSIATQLIVVFAEKLINGIKEFAKTEISKFKVDFNIAFNHYISRSFEKYSRIRTLLYRTEPKYLYDFFECNHFSFGKKKIDSCDIDNIIGISQFLIIEGTGGIGKSTTLKHLFINELQKQRQIPVYIELKDLNSTSKTLRQEISDTLTNLGFILEEKYIEYALLTGCFLILLDGFDELISNRRELIVKQINELCDRYHKNYFIISSRPDDSLLAFSRFSVLTALPFNLKKAKDLILKLEYDINIKDQFIKQLEKELYKKHISFASNPLLLNIMLLTFDNYAQIPEKLHVFYSNAFETLYFKHDATKSGYKREMQCNLPYDEFRKIFAQFCFMTYAQGSFEFSQQEIRDVLTKIRLRSSSFNVGHYIHDLLNAVCVVYQEGFTIRFTHRSFQEYFTAVYLKDLTDTMMQRAARLLLNNRAHSIETDSVFSMLFDMAQDRFEQNILLPILDKLEKQIDQNNKLISILSTIGSGVEFQLGKNKRLEMWYIMRENYSFNLLFHYAQKYKAKSKLLNKANESFEAKMVQQLQHNVDLTFDFEQISENDELLNYLHTSWLYNVAKQIAILSEFLRQKTTNQIEELDTFFLE